MSAVWKFLLTPGQPLVTPGYARILHVGEQRGRLMAWVLVHDPAAPPVERYLLIVGTGHILPSEERPYIGTAILADGDLVLHVFDEEVPF